MTQGEPLVLQISSLARPHGMEIFRDFGGGIKNVIHVSIHHLP